MVRNAGLNLRKGRVGRSDGPCPLSAHAIVGHDLARWNKKTAPQPKPWFQSGGAAKRHHVDRPNICEGCRPVLLRPAKLLRLCASLPRRRTWPITRPEA